MEYEEKKKKKKKCCSSHLPATLKTAKEKPAEKAQSSQLAESTVVQMGFGLLFYHTERQNHWAYPNVASANVKIATSWQLPVVYY